MKKLQFVFLILIAMGFIIGCSSNEENNRNEKKDKSHVEQDNRQNAEEESATSDKSAQSNENEGTDSEENPAQNTAEDKENDALSKYSPKKIEFARVWLQLGANQEIDELNVRHIKAGTRLNPDEDIDVGYPEDVIQLRGSRIVDGIVTYSGNGDGTINVYNVPARWYGGLSRPEGVSKEEIKEQMEEIVSNPKLVQIEVGEDEKIIELIKLLKIQK